MKEDSRTWVYLAIALTALLLSGCFHPDNKTTEGFAGTAMLMDREVKPAPQSLIRLQERPVFPVDDRKRPIAMVDDSKEKIKTSDKPINLQESKPE